MNYKEIIAIESPDAKIRKKELEKLRSTYISGDQFKDTFLKPHKSEHTRAFDRRKSITYIPAIARSAILTIIHALGRKMQNVKRQVPPAVNEWIEATRFESILQTQVIPDLLVTGAAYAQIEPDRSIRLPYELMQAHSADETVFLWRLATSKEKHGLVDKIESEFWYYFYENGKPVLSRIDKDGELIESVQFATTFIPIAYTTIPYPLMRDIADYQISSLNLASVDVDYLNRSGFPVYTQQQLSDESSLYGVENHSGSELDATYARQAPALTIGNNEGVSYPVGTERPDFISPEPGNAIVSMQKQAEIEEAMYRVLDLSSAYMRGQVQSGVSQAIERSEQIGLENIIFKALELYETQVYELVKEYAGVSGNIKIEYPYRTESDTPEVEEVIEEVD